MALWSTTSVKQTPNITLSNWAVYEISKNESTTRHFVGWNEIEGEGRCSSAIQEYDVIRRIGTTNSGRTYQLVGNSIPTSGDAFYVFSSWCEMNYISTSDIKNVSNEYN
jgi:hypothetical protein